MKKPALCIILCVLMLTSLFVPEACAVGLNNVISYSSGVSFNKIAGGKKIESPVSNNVIVFDSFDIAKDETVRFDNNNYLILVKDGDRSMIKGNMLGGGNIYIVNPGGVYFDFCSSVNVGNLFVSTRSLDGYDWNTYVSEDNELTNSVNIRGDVTFMGKAEAKLLTVEGNDILLNCNNLFSVNKMAVRNVGSLGCCVNSSSQSDAQQKVQSFIYSHFSVACGSFTAYRTVSTPVELQDMKNDPGGNFMLINDINVSGIQSFAPIEHFRGKFRSMGYSVTNLQLEKGREWLQIQRGSDVLTHGFGLDGGFENEIGNEWDLISLCETGGRGYLASDLILSSDLTVYGTVSLCLNGNSIDYNGKEVTTKNGADFNLYDHGTRGHCLVLDKDGSLTNKCAEGYLIPMLYIPSSVLTYEGAVTELLASELIVKPTEITLMEYSDIAHMTCFSPITVYCHKRVDGKDNVASAFAYNEYVTVKNLLSSVPAVKVENNDGKNSVTSLGCITAPDLAYGNFKLVVTFRQNGEEIRTKEQTFTSVATTVTGCASTDLDTATAREYAYIDGTYLVGLTVNGVPSGDYTVETQVIAEIKDEKGNAVEVCSEIASTDVTVQ